MGTFSGNPPLSTDQGPDPAPDVPPVNAFSPAQDATDIWNWTKSHIDDIAQTFHDVSKAEELFAKLIGIVIEIGADAYLTFLRLVLAVQGNYDDLLDRFHEEELKVGAPVARDRVGSELNILLEALGGTDIPSYSPPASDITVQGEDLWDALIKPFSLIYDTVDISKPGAGMQNMAYLLKRAMALSLGEYTLDCLKNETGFGWVSSLLPIVGFVDRAVNPTNVVRQAMEQGYSYLMRAPLQRDLNRQFPIKDLGVGALARLFIRGGIDQESYLDRCLNAGLDNTQAQQLLMEEAKLLSTSDIGKLLNHKYITQDDAIQQLKAQGYPEWQANAVLFLETHSRYFSMQESIGTKATNAWKEGVITGPQFETLMQNLGYTADEITLLETEGEFEKQTTTTETLSYSKVQDLFKANLVDVNYVINYLTGQGYSSDDTRLLVLLDFTQAEERQAREALLTNQIRVQEEQQKALAATEAAKNETDLANARLALAKELDAYMHTLGQLQALPGIMALLGISL